MAQGKSSDERKARDVSRASKHARDQDWFIRAEDGSLRVAPWWDEVDHWERVASGVPAAVKLMEKVCAVPALVVRTLRQLRLKSRGAHVRVVAVALRQLTPQGDAAFWKTDASGDYMNRLPPERVVAALRQAAGTIKGKPQHLSADEKASARSLLVVGERYVGKSRPPSREAAEIRNLGAKELAVGLSKPDPGPGLTATEIARFLDPRLPANEQVPDETRSRIQMVLQRQRKRRRTPPPGRR